MNRLLILSFLCTAALSVNGQSDSIPSPGSHIDSCRQLLLAAFEDNNRLEVQFWLDSLQRLENADSLALYWDERWLLYLWLENYTPLFLEVEQFTSGLEELASTKIPPGKDSLFHRLDIHLFENQTYLFDQIRKSWLSTEERAFAVLLVNYLLRLNTNAAAEKEYDAQLNNFLEKYPGSRFVSFIRARMYNTPPAGNWALCADLLLMQGNWSGGLEQSLRPLFGFDLAIAYWRKGWNAGVRLAVGGQKVARDIEHKTYVWPKDESSTFLGLELETGFDVINKSRLRIHPSVGGGYSSLKPSEEDEENPNPDYYDEFKFYGWHLNAAVQADIKFSLKDKSIPANSYHGVRIRLGHRWLNLSKGNPAMEGNMFFIAVGYTFFIRQPQLN